MGETRRPKSEIRKKSEIRDPKTKDDPRRFRATADEKSMRPTALTNTDKRINPEAEI